MFAAPRITFVPAAVNAPLKLIAPPSVMVPDPETVKPPVPEMVPEKVFVPLFAMLKVPLPTITEPVPVRLPIDREVCEEAFKVPLSATAPDALSDPVRLSVPAVIVVPPV